MTSLEEELNIITNKVKLTKQHLIALEHEQESLKAQIVKERFGIGNGDIITIKDAIPIQVTSITVVGDLIFDSRIFVRFGGFKQKKDGTIGKSTGYFYSNQDLKKIG